MLNQIRYDIKNINRFKQILSVFFAEGFGYLIDETPLKTYIPYHERIKKTILKDSENSFPIRIRKAFEKLGPTFIKLGQILSLRPDLIPPEYVIEFEKMLDKVPTFSGKAAIKIIETELKKPLKEIFLSFDETPFASASLAQVHRAVLFNKKEVAVKVQRPGIEEIMKNDLEIMKYIARILDKHFKKYNFNITTIITEFSRWTESELNFYVEAINAERFRENFKNSKLVYIPEIYKKYTTPKVLTSELLKGIKLNDINNPKYKNIDKTKINDNRLGIVDFGIVGEFDKRLKHKTLKIYNAIINQDLKNIASGILSLDPRNNQIDINEFERDLRYVIFPMQLDSLNHTQITGSILNILNIAMKHQLKIPIDFVLFGKTLMTIEGIAVKFAPDFKIKKESVRIINKLLHNNNWPKKIIEEIKNHSFDLVEMEDGLPDYTRDVLERLRSGKINVDLENNNVESFVNEFEKFSGNLSFGIIIGALVIGSSLVFTLEAFRYLAVIGYSLSLILSMWLIKRTIFTGNE